MKHNFCICNFIRKIQLECYRKCTYKCILLFNINIVCTLRKKMLFN